jgi:hypothetical protein
MGKKVYFTRKEGPFKSKMCLFILQMLSFSSGHKSFRTRILSVLPGPGPGPRSWSGQTRQANLKPVWTSDLQGNGQHFKYCHLHKHPIRLPDVGRTGSKPKTDKRERQINTKTKKLTSECSNPVQPDQLHSTPFNFRILFNPPKVSA